MTPPPRTLSPVEARAWLTGRLGLRAPGALAGAAGVRALLADLGCIQLDPIDRIGTNADLVALARVDGLRRGEVYEALLPGHAIEHFAKERCLLPAAHFPTVRARMAQTPWWRLSERLKRLTPGLLDAVRDAVAERGPCTAAELPDLGRVVPLDWSGWTGTAKAATLALEVLWTRGEVVVHSRTPAGKRWDLPERVLSAADRAAPVPDAAAAVIARVESAGLLPTAGGPWWGGLAEARVDGTVDALLSAGRLLGVQLPGSRKRWLAPPDLGDRHFPEHDGRVRILGPLDPMVWDRSLVQLAFGFSYVWEVYKPAAQRQYGWYVVPLLQGDRLVGRLEAHVADGRLVIDGLWEEEGFPRVAVDEALHRHAVALGVEAPGG